MIIQPQEQDYLNWTKCVPMDGDLLFFTHEGAKEFTNLPSPLLSRDEVKSKGLKVWTLNARSWYGYALNQATYCAWLPSGAIEKLNSKQRDRLAEGQRNLNVPTVFNDLWLTSNKWLESSQSEQLNLIKRWVQKNEIHFYHSKGLEDLPTLARMELKKIGYEQLLNRFSSTSGPNCFATVAGALVKDNSSDFSSRWMHWPELNQLLVDLNYSEISPSELRSGDVLLSLRDKYPIHGAYYLGDGHYFEKPGQDFYEPYRVDAHDNWKTQWPDTELSVWRKT